MHNGLPAKTAFLGTTAIAKTIRTSNSIKRIVAVNQLSGGLPHQ